MAASSSRGRSSYPFGYRKPFSNSYSSSSSFALINGQLILRSCSSTASSQFYGFGNGFTTRSMTPSRVYGDSVGFSVSRIHVARNPIGFASTEELAEDALDSQRSGDGISVMVRFRPLKYCQI